MSEASTTLLRAVNESDPGYGPTLEALRRRGETDLAEVEPRVREIIAAVRNEGDAALRRFASELEGRSVESPLLHDYGGERALHGLQPGLRRALEHAARRIREYHEHQMRALGGFQVEREGVRLASRVQPLERVGVYAPGGKAYYPSTVLMAALPATVAGVGEIIVATPAPVPEVRAACHLGGVAAILDSGGAQAVAALAYGTESVPRVDKIVGPGNVYVAAAKRLVFGQVAIDSIAGPTEILVIADDGADERLVAVDLISQAEHDEAAYPLLVCASEKFATGVRRELEAALNGLPRERIARAALRNHGVALVVPARQSMIAVANELAAEHVALHVREPAEMADAIRHAGAIFVGTNTPEATGDYLAGPSHVLPTGGSARFAAPLGVYDFVSRSSIIEYTPEALAAQAMDITALARAEGLEGHARAVEARTKS